MPKGAAPEISDQTARKRPDRKRARLPVYSVIGSAHTSNGMAGASPVTKPTHTMYSYPSDSPAIAFYWQPNEYIS